MSGVSDCARRNRLTVANERTDVELRLTLIIPGTAHCSGRVFPCRCEGYRFAGCLRDGVRGRPLAQGSRLAFSMSVPSRDDSCTVPCRALSPLVRSLSSRVVLGGYTQKLNIARNRRPEDACPWLLAWIEEDLTSFHLHRIGFEVHTGGRSFGLAGGKVKSPVVLRTFDNVTHDEAT